MKSNRSALRVFAAFSAVGILAIVFWYLWPAARSSADPACTADPKLRLVLGEQNFEVPRAYLPNIYTSNDGSSALLGHPVCQRPSDPPIIADMFSIHPGEQPSFVDDNLTTPLKGFQIEVHERRPGYLTSRPAYQEALSYLAEQGVQLQDLPEEGGFRAYDAMPKGRHVYVSLNTPAVTTDDAPLVIECTAPAVQSVSKWSSGRTCRTAGFQSLFDSAVMRYDFYDGAHPVSTWLDRDRQIRALIAAMHLESKTQQ